MSEQREAYIVAETNAQPGPVLFECETWERNIILQMRLAAKDGRLVVCDPDARCWWTTGKVQCNKEDRRLPFGM